MHSEPFSPAPTLLIVDDQPSVLVTLRFVLDGVYRVVTADSGEKAVAALADHAIDGAIIDLHMPGISGIETCQRLLTQAASASRSPRVWIMSAAATAEARRSASEAGATGFFSKPFPDDLLDQLAAGFVTESFLATAGPNAPAAAKPEPSP